MAACSFLIPRRVNPKSTLTPVYQNGSKTSYQATLDPYLDEMIHPWWSAPPTTLPEMILPEAIIDPTVLADAEFFYQKGKEKFDNQNWEDAIIQFDKALSLNPSHAEAYNFRGAAYRHLSSEHDLSVYLKNNNLAIMDFTRAALADPTWWRPINNRGISYVNRADVEPIRENRQAWLEIAINEFSQAIVLADVDTPACNRSLLYSRMGMCENAQKDLHQCSSNSFNALVSYKECIGDYQAGASLLNSTLKNASATEKPDIYHHLGQSYLEAGNYTEALKNLDLSIATTQEDNSPDDFIPGYILFEKAEAEYNLGNYQKAKEYILSGEKYTWIRWGKVYFYLGMIIWQEGKPDEALIYLEWAEKTLDESKLLDITRQEIQKIKSDSLP
jgi:tetratricopeptide (TPR) repeat protein